MKSVVVEYVYGLESVIEVYENVTKVQYFGIGDFFDLCFVIFQDEKQTLIRASEIIGFEIK